MVQGLSILVILDSTAADSLELGSSQSGQAYSSGRCNVTTGVHDHRRASSQFDRISFASVVGRRR